MQIINDTPFVVEALPFSGPQGRPVLTVIVKGSFEILAGQRCPVAFEQRPILFGDVLNDAENGGSVMFEADTAPFKPRADILLVGSAHAPDNIPAMVLDVGLRVGGSAKTIRVIGERRWSCSSRMMPEHFSRPEPFTTMELTSERAFGGIDPEGAGFCAENPLGRGFFGKKSKKALDGARLPNLEDPRHLIKSWDDHPRPVGFGVCSRSAPPRTDFLGTYDEKWRQERSPNPPQDFSFDYYNAAQPDLQVEGYLAGDEEVELTHLSPEAKLIFRLPGIRPGCSLTRAAAPTAMAEGQAAGAAAETDTTEPADPAAAKPGRREEITLNLDTLCLMPDEQTLCLVWRGTCPINDLGALEVQSIRVRTG